MCMCMSGGLATKRVLSLIYVCSSMSRCAPQSIQQYVWYDPVCDSICGPHSYSSTPRHSHHSISFYRPGIGKKTSRDSHPSIHFYRAISIESDFYRAKRINVTDTTNNTPYLPHSHTPTQVIGTIMAARQLGILIGPSFNFALTHCNFNIGPFAITNLTSPGFVMMILWTGTLAVTYVYFYDIDPPPLERTSYNRRRTLSRGRNPLFQNGDANKAEAGMASVNSDTLVKAVGTPARSNSTGKKQRVAPSRGPEDDEDAEDRPLLRSALSNSRTFGANGRRSRAHSSGSATSSTSTSMSNGLGGGGGHIRVPPLTGVGAAG